MSYKSQNGCIWLDLGLKSTLELLVLKNAVECTSQRLKWTSGARVMIMQIYANICQTYANICKYVQIYANIFKYMQIYQNICKYIHICKHMPNICKYINICKYMATICIYIYIYICMQIYENLCKHYQYMQTYVRCPNFNFLKLFGRFEFRILNSLKNYLGGSNFELRIRARFICRLFGFRIKCERNYDRTF